jgi:dienelactone hydrolase
MTSRSRLAFVGFLALGLAGAAAQQPPAVDAGALARSVIAELAAREFSKVAARFDQKMSAALPEPKLAAVWDQIVNQAGALKAVIEVAVDEVGAYRRANATTEFEKGPLLLILVFDAQQRIAGFSAKPAASSAAWTPPAYADPATFEERDLVVGDTFPLPATLSVPRGAGPFPGVVLVHGSGPQDRDTTIGPNKVFKDIAWGLATQGIAVLRYEKRTAAHPARVAQIAGLTVNDEVIEDARLAAGVLARSDRVDPKRVCLLGHSLGGTLAARIAAGDARFAGLIIMAGATRPIEDAMLDQMRYLKVDAQTIAAADAAARQIRSADLKPEDRVSLLGSVTPGSYWLDLRAYRPAQAAAALDLPMLILQGGRDYQVTTADFDGWAQALKGKPNVALKQYPALNHLFIAGGGPSRPEEYLQPGHVDSEVLTDIVAFINRL